MKKIIFLLSGIIITVLAFAETNSTDSKSKEDTGILFHQGSWEEALELAEKEGKPVFLDIYASWCGVCKKLKTKSFPDEEVAKYYNANFINVALDGEKGEGIQLVEKYDVEKFPSLIFVNSKGELIAQTQGYHSPKQLLKLGEQIAE